jgi:hypothetical protein
MIALWALVLAVDAGTPAAAAIQPPAPPPATSLRAPKDVLADYAKAMGSEDLWKRHKSVRIKREVSVKAMQFVGEQENRIARGGRILVESQMPGMGTFRQGSDGRVAWANDPIGGLRVLKGAEAEDVRISATWNSEWHLPALYAKLTAVPPPKNEPAGPSWECVELDKNKGEPTTICFDRGTHLRVWEKGVQASQGGQVPYVTKYSDWRTVDGVQVWHHEVVTVGPVTMESQIVEVVFDEPIPANLFALPRKK